ncbi:hypothetical protein BCV70DRAFT_15888 [Testicularia cyperi]|uniref:Uncharacterized protein n=1 Tax=Testicularia cyperi TaxID=1882483 RepID=A0A317Y177_9BASI|nr:hypothetical protein BCV70DRAFT_15888 [Testicularia cyperi]
MGKTAAKRSRKLCDQGGLDECVLTEKPAGIITEVWPLQGRRRVSDEVPCQKYQRPKRQLWYLGSDNLLHSQGGMSVGVEVVTTENRARVLSLGQAWLTNRRAAEHKRWPLLGLVSKSPYSSILALVTTAIATSIVTSNSVRPAIRYTEGNLQSIQLLLVSHPFACSPLRRSV